MASNFRFEANMSLWGQEVILNYSTNLAGTTEDNRDYFGYIQFPTPIDFGQKIQDLWKTWKLGAFPFEELDLKLDMVTAWMKDRADQSIINFEVMIGGIKVGVYYIKNKSDDTAITVFSIAPQGNITIDSLPGLNTELPSPISAGMRFYIASGEVDIKLTETEQLSFKQGFSIACDLTLPSIFDTSFVYHYQPKQLETDLVKAGGITEESTETAKVKWFDLDKKIGKVATIHRIGLSYNGKEKKVAILFDLAVNLSKLAISLVGLELTLALKYLQYFQNFGKADSKWKVIKNFARDAISFGLDGLGVGLETKAFTLAGLLTKNRIEVNKKEYEQYIGGIVLKTDKFSIAAVGAYGEIEGYKSFFIYGFLGIPIGGPPFFFVTGLALGFGYNRQVIIPTIDKVGDFPLVRLAMGKPDPDTSELETIRKMIPIISEAFPPLKENLFFAVGVKFNSFKLIDGFALLLVRVGEDVRIDVLGLFVLAMPKDDPVAVIEVAIRVSVIPEEGSIKVDGRITNNSYVLSKRARLSGGFAFYAWLKDVDTIKAGDFVLSIGGYHPRFNKPAHYPSVPRIELNWRVTDNIDIKAAAYFAMTPFAVMAGGSLSAIYESKRLTASFLINANFLIQWKPFFYDIDASIGVKVEYRGPLKTWRFELGIGVHIWGPEFSGIATIKYKFIKKVITFGSQNKVNSDKLSLKKFAEEFLPADQNNALTLSTLAGVLQKESPNSPSSNPFLQSQTLPKIKIDPKDFTFKVETIVPISQLTIKTTKKPAVEIYNSKGKAFGIPSVGTFDANSELMITISCPEGQGENFKWEQPRSDNFRIYSNLPAALWGTKGAPGLNPAEKTVNALNGYILKVRPPTATFLPFTIPEFTIETLEDRWNWEQLYYFFPSPPAPFEPKNTFGSSRIVFQKSIKKDFEKDFKGFALRSNVIEVNDL